MPEARKLDYIFYDEMLELASLGAQVMHSRSIELGTNYGVRIHVRSSYSDAAGTDIVHTSSDLDHAIVRGAALKKKLARVELNQVPHRTGIAGEIFAITAELGVTVDDIIQVIDQDRSTADISFTIDAADIELARQLGERMADDMPGMKLHILTDKAKVSVVGVGMKSASGVAARMFEALHGANVNIENISTSEIVISCVINEADGETALRAVHAAFGLDTPAPLK